MRIANLTNEQLAEAAIRARDAAGTDPSMQQNRVGQRWLGIAQTMEELIDRRADAASDHRKLEAGLAYDYASSLIDGCCLPVPDLGEGWFDIRDIDDADDALNAEKILASVAEAVLYLEERGLVERDATNPNHIAVRDESEAN